MRVGRTRLELLEPDLCCFCVFYVGNLEVQGRARRVAETSRAVVLLQLNGCGEHLQKAVGCLGGAGKALRTRLTCWCGWRKS